VKSIIIYSVWYKKTDREITYGHYTSHFHYPRQRAGILRHNANACEVSAKRVAFGFLARYRLRNPRCGAVPEPFELRRKTLGYRLSANSAVPLLDDSAPVDFIQAIRPALNERGETKRNGNRSLNPARRTHTAHGKGQRNIKYRN